MSKRTTKLVINGISVKTIEELRCNYNSDEIVALFQSRVLLRWLQANKYNNEANMIKRIRVRQKNALASKLAEILLGIKHTTMLSHNTDEFVNGVNKSMLAMAQLIQNNPVMGYCESIRNAYYQAIKKYIVSSGLDTRMDLAHLELYHDILVTDEEQTMISDIPEELRLFIPLDLIAIAGYDRKKVSSDNMTDTFKQISRELSISETDIFRLRELNQVNDDQSLADYMNLAHKNISFYRQSVTRFLVVALMSAGKSTLINSLAGKNVSLSRNTSCTGKIHTIISKPYEDGFVSEFDHTLFLNADNQHLMNDNVDNQSNIYVGTYFNGALGGKRFTISDTPGINSAENPEHKQITYDAISQRNYDVLIVVLNIAQLGTESEEELLKHINKNAPKTNVIFVLNKCDELSDDEDVSEIIDRHKAFLRTIGFVNPQIYPVSSYSAYLYRKQQLGQELSETEDLDYWYLKKRFKRMNLSDYYGCRNLSASEYDVECGLAGIEKIIGSYCR